MKKFFGKSGGIIRRFLVIYHEGLLSDPSTVTSMDAGTFEKCPSLCSLIFLGNAPADFDPAVWPEGMGYTVYSRAGAEGFTTPTWGVYKCQPMDE